MNAVRTRLSLARRDRGAVAVEAALFMPLIVLLVLGMLEYGLVIKDASAASAAVRAGARTASAMPRQATYADTTANQVSAAIKGKYTDTAIQALWIYRARSDGLPDGGIDSCSVCAKYTWDGGSDKFVLASNNWPAVTQNACVTGPPNSVGVMVRINHGSVTNMFFSSYLIKEYATLALEPVPVSMGCS